MKFIFLLLLIVASIGVLIGVVIPRYHAVQAMQATVSSDNASLATATQLEQSRQALIAQYNNIPQTDLTNIETLLPDSVNNIGLIIQINALATKDGLSSLENVDYDPTQIPTTADGTAGSAAAAAAAATQDPTTAQLPYGEFDMTFQTAGQYSNFLTFLSDLEQNLRLVDVTEIDFLPPTASDGSVPSAADGLTYKISLQTYWLK